MAMRAEISLLGSALRLSINDTRIGFVAFGSGTPRVFSRARLVSIDDRSRDVASSAASAARNCSNAVRGSTGNGAVAPGRAKERALDSRAVSGDLITANRSPHSLQNFATAGFPNPHCEHDLVVRLVSVMVILLTRHSRNSSSSRFRDEDKRTRLGESSYGDPGINTEIRLQKKFCSRTQIYPTHATIDSTSELLFERALGKRGWIPQPGSAEYFEGVNFTRTFSVSVTSRSHA